MKKGSLSIVKTVSSAAERDRLIKLIYTRLLDNLPYDLRIRQDSFNKIGVYHHVSEGVEVLIRSYTVIVVPVLIDLSPLENFFGRVDFRLGDTIKMIDELRLKLNSMNGYHETKGKDNEAKFRKLVDCLR